MKLVRENINEFVRNQDPVKSLGLGYEAKIREFFRHYNIPDGDYKIEDDGDIIFNTDIDLDGASISKFPNQLRLINGTVNLDNTNICELPNNLTIFGDIWLQNTPISKLPNNLIVQGGLIINNTKITKLPDDLTIGGVISNQKELINFIKNSKFKYKLSIWL